MRVHDTAAAEETMGKKSSFKSMNKYICNFCLGFGSVVCLKVGPAILSVKVYKKSYAADCFRRIQEAQR